jgi:FkbM family methyltransferase
MNSVNIKKVFKELMDNAVNPFLPPPYDNKSVIIYGAGQMGEASSTFLVKAGVKVECFIDKNPNIRGKLINNIPVIHPEDLSYEQKQKYLFAVGVIKISYNSIAGYLRSIGCKNICYVGHLIQQSYGKASIANVWYFDSMTYEERNALNAAFEQFADDTSRISLIQLLYWIILGIERDELQTISDPEDKYFISEVMDVLRDDEIFVDCGAYNGNTIARIESRTNSRYAAIHSFEPGPENFKILQDSVQKNPNRKKISIYPFGLGIEDAERNFTVGLGLTSRYTATEKGQLVPMKRLDSAMTDVQYSFLKVYGLGIGWEVIAGASQTLTKYRPIVAINIHHSRADLVKVPQLLMESLKNYNFYLRLHGYCGSEAVMYAIPQERKQKTMKDTILADKSK